MGAASSSGADEVPDFLRKFNLLEAAAQVSQMPAVEPKGIRYTDTPQYKTQLRTDPACRPQGTPPPYIASQSSSRDAHPQTKRGKKERKQTAATRPTQVEGSPSTGLWRDQSPFEPGRVRQCKEEQGFSDPEVQEIKEIRKKIQDGMPAENFVNFVQNNVWRLSKHSEGCWLVQDVLGRVDRPVQEMLASELKSHVVAAVSCPHANHVLQKVIVMLPPQSSIFIAEELAGIAAQRARHKYGCRIFARLLEHSLSQEVEMLALIDKAIEEAHSLCCHKFGHYVALSVLEHGDPRHQKVIAEALLKDPVSCSKNDNASYVVEGVLNAHAGGLQEARLQLINVLTTPENVTELVLSAESKGSSFVIKSLARQDPAIEQLIQGIVKEPQYAAQLRTNARGLGILKELNLATEEDLRALEEADRNKQVKESEGECSEVSGS